MQLPATSAAQELRAGFLRDGYVIVEDDILDGIDFQSIWGALTELDVGADRVQDGWQRLRAVRAIASHPRVLETLRILYDRRPIPFQTLNFKFGSQQRTHSDVIHFSSFPSGLMCGVWVALEDVTLESGPLRYFPGSHRLPEMHYDDFGIPVPRGPFDWLNPATKASYFQYEDAIEALMRTNGLHHTDLELKRGSFLVWAANLHHGGAPRLDHARSRKSQVTHYFFENSIPYTPMFSRPKEGLYLIRNIRNIVTGRMERANLDRKAVLFGNGPEGLRSFRVAESPLDHALCALAPVGAFTGPKGMRLVRGLKRLSHFQRVTSKP